MKRPFSNRFDAPRLSPAEAERQGRISTLAFNLLGRDGAMAFLNARDAEPGPSRLQQAIKSEDGFAAVERALRESAAP